MNSKAERRKEKGVLTDELCCVSLCLPEGEKDRTGRHARKCLRVCVCACVCVFNMSISRCSRHVYHEYSEKMGKTSHWTFNLC